MAPASVLYPNQNEIKVPLSGPVVVAPSNLMDQAQVLPETKENWIANDSKC